MRREVFKRKVGRYRYGLWAEALCRAVLRMKGYRILASRHRTPLGEIDILAARGQVLAVIEVKARRGLDQAALAITPRQQMRLARAANSVLAQRPEYMRGTVRFDLMLVAPWRWPRHIVSAWEGI